MGNTKEYEAFINHWTACKVCKPNLNRYCDEGQQLKSEADKSYFAFWWLNVSVFVSAWVSVINTCLSLITDFMSVSNLVRSEVRSEVRSKVRSKVRTENTI